MHEAHPQAPAPLSHAQLTKYYPPQTTIGVHNISRKYNHDQQSLSRPPWTLTISRNKLLVTVKAGAGPRQPCMFHLPVFVAALYPMVHVGATQEKDLPFAEGALHYRFAGLLNATLLYAPERDQAFCGPPSWANMSVIGHDLQAPDVRNPTWLLAPV